MFLFAIVLFMKLFEGVKDQPLFPIVITRNTWQTRNKLMWL